MKEAIDPSRREFTLASALALLGGVTITVGCGGGGGSYSSPSSPSSSTGGPSGAAGTVSDNHGHQAVITAAEMTAGNALNLDIQGEATHPHMVSLSAADLATIRAGRAVVKASSDTEAHHHQVTFDGSAPNPNPGGGY